MKTPATPENESERQQVLDALDIVYSPTEERFDKITRVAKRLFDVPIVLISLVTRDKQWFKSCQGLNVSETGREISFCGHAIHQDEAFVVPNACKDPDFSDNPLVTGEPKIRFYAGQPLIIDGQRIGTLCLIDRHPRHLKPKDYDSLKCLAKWVETEMLAWKTGKNRLIEQSLNLSNRQSLIDGLTGDLHSDVLDTLLGKLESLGASDNINSSLKVKINNLSKLPEQQRDNLIKACSKGLHQIIGDRGLVAFDRVDEFSLMLNDERSSEPEVLVSELQRILQTEAEGELAKAIETIHLQIQGQTGAGQAAAKPN
jgi:hypothetical protein